jgi:hypothetical protein
MGMGHGERPIDSLLVNGVKRFLYHFILVCLFE